MNAVLALAQKDLRVIYRDRFMLFIAAYALVLAVVARFGAPWVPVANFALYIAPAMAMFGTLLLGTVLGFALVEEREQGTWLLLRVLPIGVRRVFVYLTVTTSGASLAISFVASMIYGYPVARWPAFWFMLVASAPVAPLMMLAIGALAKNKIEGLAVSKIMSAAGILPVLVFFVPPSWQLVGAWCPLYWMYLGLLQAYAADPAVFEAIDWPGYPLWWSGAMSLALSLTGIAVLVRRYARAAS